MPLRPVLLTIEALAPAAVRRFWAEALGPPDPLGLGVEVVSAPGPRPAVKNRVHLDLATTSAAHQAELVARLEDLGATPVDIGQGDVPWTVLADPEGNVLCVLEPREVYRDTGPIAAVVVDCADPRAMARFWDGALDWTLREVADDHAVLRSAEEVGPYLEFFRTPDTKTVPDRVLLGLLCRPGDDQEAETARLRALGATELATELATDGTDGTDGTEINADRATVTPMSDPEGHDFRVIAAGS
ncbi:VOC family protein [Streptomyces sp. NPDC002232]|uniref:VOC family protein n=1 Tax=Streptomyces sp. NPDC002232 TaxID=3364640 RepID=UPI0036CB1715